MDGRYGGSRVLDGTVGVTQMSVSRIKNCLMAGVIAALVGVVATDVQAQHKHRGGGGGDCCSPCGPVAGGADCNWVTQKVKVTEMVPTMVDQCVTVMQQQQKQETYTAYKTECVPETVTKQVTVMQK